MSNKFDSRSLVHNEYLTVKRRFNLQRTKTEIWADWLTKTFGSIQFLLFHLIWFSLWIIINLGLTPIKPFDPYPFGFLTLVVSLEAIFFSIVILISENREQKVNDFREELSLALLKVIEKKIDNLTKSSKNKYSVVDIEEELEQELKYELDED